MKGFLGCFRRRRDLAQLTRDATVTLRQQLAVIEGRTQFLQERVDEATRIEMDRGTDPQGATGLNMVTESSCRGADRL